MRRGIVILFIIINVFFSNSVFPCDTLAVKSIFKLPNPPLIVDSKIARLDSVVIKPWKEFKPFTNNPVSTNRDYDIKQGHYTKNVVRIGDAHGDFHQALFPLVNEGFCALTGDIVYFNTKTRKRVNKENADSNCVVFPAIEINSDFKNKNMMFQFLGDYGDRGEWTDEIFYFLYDLVGVLEKDYPDMQDCISLVAGNHDFPGWVTVNPGYNGKNADNYLNAVKDLFERKKMKMCNVVNGVFYSHSFLSIEYLFKLYQAFPEIKEVIEFFAPGIGKYETAEKIDFGEIKRDDLLYGVLFTSKEYYDNLEKLAEFINDKCRTAIIEQDVKNVSELVLVHSGLLWASLKTEERNLSVDSRPCPNIQIGHGHTVVDNIPDEMGFDGQVFKRILNFDGGASYEFNPEYSHPRYVRDGELKGDSVSLDILEIDKIEFKGEQYKKVEYKKITNKEYEESFKGLCVFFVDMVELVLDKENVIDRDFFVNSNPDVFFRFASCPFDKQGDDLEYKITSFLLNILAGLKFEEIGNDEKTVEAFEKAVNFLGGHENILKEKWNRSLSEALVFFSNKYNYEISHVVELFYYYALITEMYLKTGPIEKDYAEKLIHEADLACITIS
ncbi:hypothetical protein KKC59_03250, partial [bacterium]|nr:hypothetical protein [bacterium]